MELKRITKAAIPGALEKALRYRLLNEPLEAESICRDIIDVEPDNQKALITLLLAMTDQFVTEFTKAQQAANDVLSQLRGEYEQAYYEGMIHERWANAQVDRNMPAEIALGWYRKAMRCYEKAESLASSDNPEAALRWNTCARCLKRHEHVERRSESNLRDVQGEFGGDDVPLM